MKNVPKTKTTLNRLVQGRDFYLTGGLEQDPVTEILTQFSPGSLAEMMEVSPGSMAFATSSAVSLCCSDLYLNGDVKGRRICNGVGTR